MASDKDERLLSVASEHWVKYILPVLVYVLLLGVSVLLFFFAELSAHHYMWLSHITFLTGLLLMILCHHWFFLMLLSEDLGAIIITNKRVIHLDSRLLSQDLIQEISYERVKFVHTHKKGFFQNVFRYGSIIFDRGQVIPLVRHPNGVARDIERAMGMK